MTRPWDKIDGPPHSYRRRKNQVVKLALAPGFRVIGIYAKQNAISNGIDNVEYYAHDLMSTDFDSDYFNKSYSKILLDPPRSGAQEIIRHLNLDTIEKFVYVSCNPATLARDAGILVNEKGMKIVQTGIMDMFPHTSHVESIALFEHQ